MKRCLLLLMIFIIVNLFAVYEVGDVVDDYSWTDDSGEYHSVHELVASGKVVVMDWGGYG